MPAKKPASPKRQAVGVERRGAAGFVLVHPRDVLERQEDLEEVYAMLEAGEWEIAREELLWLLEGCGEFIEAHRLLGEVALEQNDIGVAEGHFGYGFQLGAKALPVGFAGPLRYSELDNAPLFEAGKGLAYCALERGKYAMAEDVVQKMLLWDPSDPLEVGDLTEAIAALKAGRPVPTKPVEPAVYELGPRRKTS